MGEEIIPKKMGWHLQDFARASVLTARLLALAKPAAMGFGGIHDLY
jgi:hypothetical protein